MEVSLDNWPVALLRATVALTIAALIVHFLIRLIKSSSPIWQRSAWVLVLLHGLFFLQLSVEIPWNTTEVSVPRPFATAHLGETELTNTAEISRISTHRPAVAPQPNEDPNWKKLFVLIWLTGGGLVLFRWLLSYALSIKCLLSTHPEDGMWMAEWQSLLAEDGVRRIIPLHVTRHTGPALCFLPWGYRVVVPEDLWQTFSSDERLAVLRHELAHYRRKDIWSSLLIRIPALLHWFNPLAWWVVRRLDECAEWQCDDAVVQDDPSIATVYSRALIHLGSLPRQAYISAPAASGGRLHLRIRRLLTPKASERSRMKKLVLVVVPFILLVISVLRVQLVAKDQETESERKTQPAVLVADVTDQNPAPADRDPKNSYKLEKGEILKFYKRPRSDLYLWDNGELKLKTSNPGAKGTSLFHVLYMLTKLQPVDLDGDSKLWLTKISGDFVLQKGVTVEEIVEELEIVLNQQLKMPVRLEFHKVERNVYIAQGNFKPSPKGPFWRTLVKPARSYLIYGKEGPEIHKYPSASNAGQFADFLKAIGTRVGQPVIYDGKNAPQGYFGWRVYLDSPQTLKWRNFPKNFARNPELVLKHISEQTGLTFRKEKRKVRLLILERNR